MTKQDKLKQFWDYELHPITGFRENNHQLEKNLKAKAKPRTDLMKEKLVAPFITMYNE